MSDSVTIAKAIIEVGATGADAAKDEIQTLETRLAKLEAQYTRGNITISAYAQRTQKLKDEIAALKGGVDTATAALQRHGTAQAAIASLDVKAPGGMKNMQMGFLELSRAFEDAQYGLRGVLNNIPTTIQMFGGPAGLAAGVSAVAVAFNIALPYLQKYATELGIVGDKAEDVKGPIDELHTRIAKLEAKPIKLRVDYEEIEKATKEVKRLEEAKRAFDDAGKGRDPYEKKAGEAAKDVFDLPEGQGEAIKQKLFDQVFGEMKTRGVSESEAGVKEAEARVATATDAASKRMAGEQLRIAQAKLQKALKGNEADKAAAGVKVGELFQGINEGNDPKARAEMARRLRKAGEENLARSVELASPEELLKQDQVDDKFDESMGRHGGAEGKRDAKAKIAKAQADAIDEDNRRTFDDWQKARAAAQDKEDARLAGAMTGSVGQSYLKNPGMDDATLQDEIKTAMVKAGMGAEEIAEAVTGVAKKLRENLDKAVEARALDKGISDAAARAELVKEDQKKDDKNLPKSEVMSTESYLSKVLVAGLGKKDDNVPKDQLVEAKKTNDKLDGVLKELAKPQKSIPATVGPGR